MRGRHAILAALVILLACTYAAATSGKTQRDRKPHASQQNALKRSNTVAKSRLSRRLTTLRDHALATSALHGVNIAEMGSLMSVREIFADYPRLVADIATNRKAHSQSPHSPLLPTFLEETQTLPSQYNFFEQHPSCAAPAVLQGVCGSCLIHASLNALSARICRTTKHRPLLSAASALSNLLPNATAAGKMESCSGATPNKFMLAMSKGVSDRSCCPEELFQCTLFEPLKGELNNEIFKPLLVVATELKCYQEFTQQQPVTFDDRSCPTSHCVDGAQAPQLYSAKGFHVVAPAVPAGNKQAAMQAVKAIQEEIFEHGPVMAIISETPVSLYAHKSGVYRKPPSSEEPATPAGLLALFLSTAHAVMIYGWGEEAGTPYWLIENSWSAQWAEKGHFKLLRGQNELGVESAAFAYIPPTAPNQLPSSYDPTLDTLRFAYPYLRSLAQIALSYNWSPVLTRLGSVLTTCTTAIRLGDDASALRALTDLVPIIQPVIVPDLAKMAVPMQNEFMLKTLLMVFTELEDPEAAALVDAAALTVLTDTASANELKLEHVPAFEQVARENRATLVLMTEGEEPGVPYTMRVFAFQRILGIKTFTGLQRPSKPDAQPLSEAEETQRKETILTFMRKHWAVLRPYLLYKLDLVLAAASKNI